jgi:hypothetical protein
MARKPKSDLPDRSYTLMWVPQGGRDRVRQITISLKQMRMGIFAGTLVLALGMVGLVLMAGSLPRSQACDSLLEENLQLKSRLQDIERRITEGEEHLRRLRLYDDQLGGLDGYGPMDDAEVAVAQLVPMDGLAMLDVDPVSGEYGVPMHELEGVDLLPADMTPTEAWALSVQSRADRLLMLATSAEPGMGRLVETAEDERARRHAYPQVWPVRGAGVSYTSGFGYRRSPFTRIWKLHTGIDISAPIGSKVRAASSGVVISAGERGGYGLAVVVDHGYRISTLYAHNAELMVTAGQVVQQGQVISLVGMTGQTTGPHLHFELIRDGNKINPLDHMPLRKTPKRAKRPNPGGTPAQ